MKLKVDFDTFVDHVIIENLKINQLIVESYLVPYTEQIFSDEFKQINSKDPKFTYCCRCNFIYTIWDFAYSDIEILEEATAYIKEELNKLKSEKNITYDENTNNTERLFHPKHACDCPFENKT